MAIEKKLICCKTQANFDKQLEAGNILDYSIVFIKDTQRIWTHGTYFSSLAELMEDIASKQDKLTPGTNVEITEDNVINVTVDLSDYETTKAAETSHQELKNEIEEKQNKLTAGENIKIAEDGTISADVNLEEYDKIADREALIEDSTDDEFIIKCIDSAGNVLAGIKLNGELYAPIGIPNDTYDLIYKLYEKLQYSIDALTNYAQNCGADTYDTIAARVALIEESTDDNYVVKVQDSTAQILGGITTNGEILANGLTDGAYEVIKAMCEKMDQINDCLKAIQNRLS